MGLWRQRWERGEAGNWPEDTGFFSLRAALWVLSQGVMWCHLDFLKVIEAVVHRMHTWEVKKLGGSEISQQGKKRMKQGAWYQWGQAENSFTRQRKRKLTGSAADGPQEQRAGAEGLGPEMGEVGGACPRGADKGRQR